MKESATLESRSFWICAICGRWWADEIISCRYCDGLIYGSSDGPDSKEPLLKKGGRGMTTSKEDRGEAEGAEKT
mgnify:CR=1 FL=1